MSGVPLRAAIVGTGLIGGSIGMALRERSWHVSGVDADKSRAGRAEELGAIDRVGMDGDADLVVVAVPASQVAVEVAAALDGTRGGSGRGVVTDVAGVKARIAASTSEGRFVGGHPMAGSEKEGIEGSDPRLFAGRTWVLTPTEHTDSDSYAFLHGVVTSLGAHALAMTPDKHDWLVALVSHVPHFAAAALMFNAGEEARESAELLQLAAGGFRDMTRVAAGHAEIWPDLCEENADAICIEIDSLVRRLEEVRTMIESSDRDGLLAFLNTARAARQSLPAQIAAPERTAELRVPVVDRPGVIGEVAMLAAELQVNITDIEIAHARSGGRGELVLLVDAMDAERLAGHVRARGYEPRLRGL